MRVDEAYRFGFFSTCYFVIILTHVLIPCQAFYTCQWSQCLLFCYIVKQKTWKKETEDLRIEMEASDVANATELASAALASAKRRFLIVGGAVTAVAIIISIGMSFI